MDGERGRATGGAEGAGCGALAWIGGTAEDYALLDALAKPYIAKTGERVLDDLKRMLGLDVGSAEQIGMGPGSRQHNVIVVNVPDQQPVRLDMTFPSARPLPGQAVGPVAAIKRLLGEEQVDDEPQLLKVLAASFA